MNVFGIILAVIAIVVGYGIGYYVRKNVHEKELDGQEHSRRYYF